MPKTSVTKADFIARVAEKTEISKTTASAVLDAIAETVKEALQTKKEVAVVVPGLAKFTKIKVKARKARTQPHPAIPGKKVKVEAKPAHWVIRASSVPTMKKAD